MFKTLFRYCKPHKWISLILFLSILLEAGLESATRFSFRFLIDAAIIPRNGSKLVLILGLLGAATLTFSALSLLGDYLWARLGTLVVNQLRTDLYRHVQGLSMAFFGRRSSGDVLNCFLVDVETIENCLVTVVPYALMGIWGILFATFFMASIQPWMAVATLIGFGFCFTLPRLVLRKASQASLATRRQSGRLASVIQETLQGQSVIKVFNLEQETARRFDHESATLVRLAIRGSFLAYVVQRIPMVAFFMLSLLVLGCGAVLAFQGHLSIGEIVSFQILVLGLNASIANLTWLAPVVIDAAASMERLNEIFRERPTVVEAAQPRILAPLRDQLCLDAVTFAYPRPAQEAAVAALSAVSLSFGKGEFAVLVGPSGSGKSSVLQLLLRLYDPSQGRVLFDGVDLREVSLASLRAQIGFVAQDILLFDMTLRDNIRMGKLDASDEEILAALQSAEIADLVASLPNGLDTMLGERGARFSGGERQRFILARALVRQPAILVLDEATSALDMEKEGELLLTLKHLAQGRGLTVIAVTHRLRLAALADRVILLRDGLVACTGRHDELLKMEGAYAALCQQSTTE